jgi:H+/gluconate symporter-like permease
MNLATQLRHLLTGLATIGGLLVTWNLIAPEDVATANAAGAALIEPMTVLGGLLAGGLLRLVMGWIFSKLTGKATLLADIEQWRSGR